MSEETKTSEDTQVAAEETKSLQVNLTTFFGVKAGMTRIFNEEGTKEPVTVVKLIPNVISQVKTDSKDGYTAYQVSYGEKKEKLITSPRKGHLKKAGLPGVYSASAEVVSTDVNPDFLGQPVTLENFEKGSYVDVSGTSKGKGFQGVVKKFGFAGGPMTHGSHFHRAPGSIGNRATPGRVFKQKKMPGRLGGKTTTVQNLRIIDVNLEKGFLLISGSVPGSKNGFVQIKKAVKR